MRRLLPFATLFLAACATAPRTPVDSPATPAPTRPVRGGVLGLTEADLTARFGPAPFRVREGAGLKLQWQSANCVLDTYLYPPERGAGAATVLHADARRPGTGETMALDACLATFPAR